MARVDDKALERAGQALNARISSGDWPGATREIIETYLDEAERSKAPEEAIERACISYWGEHTFFRIFGEKSRRGIREAMRRAATEFASDPQEFADNPEVRTDDLASQLRWFSEKKKWPRGLEGMPELLAKAAEAVSSASGPVGVKALEWREDWGGSDDDIVEWVADTPWGRVFASVAGYRDADGKPYARHADVPNGLRIRLQALAQIEHEVRIRSAVATHVQDATENKPLDLNITKEWFEKRSALEGDHEIGAGSRKITACIDPTPDELAELFRIAHRIPEGWQLVPIEPTQEMCEAAPSLPAIDAIGDLPLKKAGWSMSAIVNRKRYLAMLAAASAKREG